MLVNTKNSPKNYLPTKFFVRRLHAWGLSICTWYPQTNYMKCSIDESWVNIEMFICHIYSHNSFQHHCGNWETIIRELCPKWCLNKKIIMKKKKKKAWKTLLTQSEDGDWHKRQAMILYCSKWKTVQIKYWA